MKIVFLIEHLCLGGVLRRLSLLAEQLERRQHQVHLVALYQLDQDWNLVWKRDVNILVGTPIGFPTATIGLIRALLALRRLIKNNQSDILYSVQGANARLISWLATRGLHSPRLVWGVTGFGLRNPYQNWKRGVLSHLGKWASGSVPLMIANSRAGLINHNNRGYCCIKQLVIHNGFDTDEFKPDPEARTRVRAEWRIENERLIGIVGRISISKGHRAFLQAATLLRERRKHLRFVVIGAGPEKPQLELLSQEFGLLASVIWTGTRHDMSAVYNALDILCSASDREGFPNVIGEAMACGVPCVVTDVGDCRDVVGDDGIVVLPGDPYMLANGLEAILSKLDTLRPLEIRRRIVSDFSLQAMVEGTEKALKDICH